ncbi:MAG: hypothetical protein V3U82_04960 [Robiginitomaculum sp.]
MPRKIIMPNDMLSFTYEGNRGLLIRRGENFDTGALASCIEKALTYHKNK